ncbi:DUF1156 domain-containing protein [Pyrofollis japonicus]
MGARRANIVRIVNEYSLSEKSGGGRPDYWEMVFWWTRKPLVGARFVIAASLLPENTDIRSLAKALRLLEDKSPHSLNPDLNQLGKRELIERIRSAKLLDPFAGFGSIPLEAIRLGVSEAVAVELLPTAYVFLKAVLEYPVLFGKHRVTVKHDELKELSDILDIGSLKRKGLARETPSGVELPALLYDVARWGKWIVDRLREDPDIKELYDDDVAVYIGTWEIKCPHSGKYSPMIGNYWLARTRQGNRYQRLVYMQPKVNNNGEVEIEIIDLNKMGKDVTRATINGNTIRIGNETYNVPEPNIAPRSNTATCIQDRRPLGYIDPETGKTYTTKEQAPQMIRKRLEWYPKWAIKQWNKLLEDYLEGKISLDELRNAPARPRLLAKAKIVNGDLDFQPATQQDTEKLWKALEKLKQICGDPDIPTEPLWTYTSGTAGNLSIITWGFNKFYKLFNPRQLLALVKLAKLIRKAGKKTEEMKLREGWSEKEAFRYAEAVTTYLAIALIEHARYNAIVTSWNPTSWAESKIRDALSFRGIAMVWNFVEVPVSISKSGKTIMYSYSWSMRIETNSLKYLIFVTSPNSLSYTKVLLDDTTTLSKLGVERFSTIVTDPPYYDDVPYSELSDFYYVWLKRALSDVKGGRLVPRFVADAFFRRVGGAWFERRTQWEEVARREISVNLGRLGNASLEDAVKWFEERLGQAFRTMSGFLGENGIIVTYYNHTSVDAWASLLRAGWELGGLRVSSAVPLVTESGTRVTARGKIRLDTSIVVAWRKREDSRRCDAAAVEAEALERARSFALKIVREGGVVGYDLLFAALGAALSVLTRCEKIIHPKGVLDSRGVADLAYRVAGRAVAEALSGVGGAVVSSAPARFYLVARTLFSEAGDIRLDGQSMGLLGIALGITDYQDLVRSRLVARARDAFVLHYPRDARSAADLERLLRERGLERDPERAIARSSVDILHLLYYGAARGTLETYKQVLRTRYPGLYDEALGIAKVLCKLLPEDDAEKNLACRVVSEKGGALDTWLKK